MSVGESASAVATAGTAARDPAFWLRTVPEGECVVWTGYRDPQGYGCVTRKAVARSPILTHRYAWMLANGPIPDGAVVMHVCDRPSCVRLEHLRLGTQVDNIADREAKGRGRPGRLLGEEHPQRKFRRVLQAEVAEGERLREALGLVAQALIELVNEGWSYSSQRRAMVAYDAAIAALRHEAAA